MRWSGIILGLTIASTQVAVGSAKAQSEGGYASSSCEQLWTSRNSIYAQKGYCFTSPQAQAVFGKGCTPPFGKLTEIEQAEVDVIGGRVYICQQQGSWFVSSTHPRAVQPWTAACRAPGRLANRIRDHADLGGSTLAT